MSFSIFGYDFTLSELITTGLTLFLTLFYAIKTRGLKNIIKEVLDMNYKFRTANSVEPSNGQTFDTEKPVYRLNNATGELELSGDKVILQEVVNSCVKTALDHVLDRLLPQVEQAKDVVELDLMREDLDYAMDVCNKAEEYRQKLNLSDKLSVEEIYSELAKSAELLKAKIDTAKSLTNKEVSQDEEETIKESK